MTARPAQTRATSPFGQLLLLTALVAGATTAVIFANLERVAAFDLSAATGLAAAFFATRLLTIRLPQGDDVYVTLAVGLVGLVVADIVVVMTAFAVAAAVESIARHSQSSREAASYRAVDAVRGTAVLGLMAPWQLLLRSTELDGYSGEAVILLTLAAGAAYASVDLVTMAVQQRAVGGLPIAQGVAALQRPLTTMYLVHLPMAAVTVRLQMESVLWALPVALLLTLILQNSFNLYLRIRRGYADTISALAHAAELDRPHDTGHARRVADMAVAVGRGMRLSTHELEKIGYAALLHDIGRMGDTTDDHGQAHAQRGAEIVSSIPFLMGVAPLICGEGDDGTSSSPIGYEIVRACSHYDRLRAEVGAHAALEQLLIEAGGVRGRVLESLDSIVRGQNSGPVRAQ
ncbi:MAG: HD domain-containing protein [Actinobacteria bacterium]|nr:HD domain-containing protein [Actinomycetota bacterium]